MNDVPLEGWVPIRLFWQGTEPLVEWCHLGRERFTHPFFDSTIQLALQTPFNSLFRHHTTMATLAEWSRRSPGISPSGFIFHMSRCGSTVISQLLSTLPQNVVVAEAGPVDALARAYLRAPAAPLEQRIAWVRWMVSALGQRRAGCERHYFLKFDARTTFEMPLLRQAFPEVPWIFVYRDPVEVLVSLMERPAAMTTPGMGDNLLGLPMSVIPVTPPEEYAARVLGLLCEAARQQFPNQQFPHQRGMLVHYRQIPRVAWEELPGHFGFDLSYAAIERMKAAASLDAKDRSRRFETDSARRQAEASDEIRRAARQWVAAPYEMLERVRGQGLA